MRKFNSPISDNQVQQILEIIDLPIDAYVLDVGCGRGEFLIELVKKYDVNGIGVDNNLLEINEAKAQSTLRTPHSNLTFNALDVQKFPTKPNSFDLAICIGSSHIYELGEHAYSKALSSLIELVRPGGQLLIGECFWMQPPQPEYLEVFGEYPPAYVSHLENITIAEKLGLVFFYASVSTQNDWDHFEGLGNLVIEKEALQKPHDPKVVEKVKVRRKWRNAYLRWGRDTLGFALYLFSKR